jgi:hypothetical protein
MRRKINQTYLFAVTRGDGCAFRQEVLNGVVEADLSAFSHLREQDSSEDFSDRPDLEERAAVVGHIGYRHHPPRAVRLQQTDDDPRFAFDRDAIACD